MVSRPSIVIINTLSLHLTTTGPVNTGSSLHITDKLVQTTINPLSNTMSPVDTIDLVSTMARTGCTQANLSIIMAIFSPVKLVHLHSTLGKSNRRRAATIDLVSRRHYRTC